MTERGQIWKCEVCGNIITILHSGADSLVCCNQPMKLQEAKIEDSEIGEKHIPIIEGLKIKVGNVEHPMDKDHYIEWIEASDGIVISKIFLKPGDKPEAEFHFEIRDTKIYCNKHGLWSNR